jgi:hypothetical protein
MATEEQTRSPHHELRERYGAPTLEAGAGNSVQLDPGGQTFPTIGAALASITDASQQKQYLLTCSPGTFNEQVTLEPWCFLQGSGTDQTTVSAPPVQDAFSRGTVIGAGNSSISDMTVVCMGGSWGDWSTALNVGGSAPFYAEQVVLLSDDQGNAGINSETVAVNWNTHQPAQAQFYLAYSTVSSSMESGQSTAVGMIVNAASAELTESKVSASGGDGSFGAQSNGGAVVNLYNCAVGGQTFALNIPDGASTLIATNSQISGPVGQGVQIVNN